MKRLAFLICGSAAFVGQGCEGRATLGTLDSNPTNQNGLDGGSGNPPLVYGAFHDGSPNVPIVTRKPASRNP